MVGTLGGTSADETLIDTLVDSLRTGFAPYELGISVAENVLYSGGFIIRKHHDPSAGVHAIQMEVTMDTYMYEADAVPNQRYALKQQRLDIIRSVLRKAIETNCQTGLPLGREGGGGLTPPVPGLSGLVVERCSGSAPTCRTQHRWRLPVRALHQR